MASAEVQPWERQDAEPEAAYEAFKGYLLQSVPRRLGRSSVKQTEAQLSVLFNEWRWSERALAYDRHLEKIRQEERESLLRQDEKDRLVKYMTVLETTGELLNRELTKHYRESQNSQVSATKLSDLNKLMGTWITMSRLIHGQSTENVEVRDAKLEKLTVEELRELQRLHAKMAEEEDAEKVH